MKKHSLFGHAIFLTLLVFIFTACEKDITLDIPPPEDKIVVEGWIEQDKGAHVILSRNSAYFSVIDSAALADIIISDATVTIKEIETGLEEELTMTVNFNFFPPFIFKGSSVLGKINHSYELTVIADDVTLTAITSIPEIVPMDSVWFEPDDTHDTLGLLFFGFTDPPELGNHYRVFAKRLNKDIRFVPVFGSVYDDIFFNGQEVEYGFYRGRDRYKLVDEDEGIERFFFKVGDTIVSRVAMMDKKHFDFWRSIEEAIYAGGNPFAAPTSIASNIEGGLGVWGGYAATYDTIIAKFPE